MKGIDGTLYSSLGERALIPLSDRARIEILMRFELKSVRWMMHRVSNFYNAEELVLHTCGSSLEPVKACLQLLKHRAIVRSVKGIFSVYAAVTYGVIREAGLVPKVGHGFD